MTPEEKREWHREYKKKYYEANQEALKEQSREYYRANKETIRARQRAYHAANREALLAKQVEYDAKNRDRVKSAREARKLAAIERMGGCCADCKQTFHHSMYDFHHLNPTEKEHEPYRLFAQKDQAKIDAELAKCVLLCSNCHRFRHYTD